MSPDSLPCRPRGTMQIRWAGYRNRLNAKRPLGIPLTRIFELQIRSSNLAVLWSNCPSNLHVMLSSAQKLAPSPFGIDGGLHQGSRNYQRISAQVLRTLAHSLESHSHQVYTSLTQQWLAETIFHRHARISHIAKLFLYLFPRPNANIARSIFPTLQRDRAAMYIARQLHTFFMLATPFRNSLYGDTITNSKYRAALATPHNVIVRLFPFHPLPLV